MSRVLFFSSLLLISMLGIHNGYAGTYNVCQGEYSERGKGKCPPGQPYVYCPAKGDKENKILKQKAASLCEQEGSKRAPTIVHLRNESGNGCGYGFYQVTCK